jgi:hypothetical protein
MASMSDDEERRPDSEAEIEREIRQGGKLGPRDLREIDRLGEKDGPITGRHCLPFGRTTG